MSFIWQSKLHNEDYDSLQLLDIEISISNKIWDTEEQPLGALLAGLGPSVLRDLQ